MDYKSKAALYIRVSTEEQANEGLSVDAQIETLTQYCRLYNIDIYNVYKDLGISGKDTTNRPGLRSMLSDAKEQKFNLVLVWKISRLSRSLKDLLMILDILEKYNIAFISYSEKLETSTSVGKMTLQLLGSIAEFERNTIVDNVKLGLREYARKGGKTGTVLGYDNINKKLEINAEEAEIIKMIFKLYTVNKMSMASIAEKLNSIGVRTKRSNCFTKGSISVILSNPVYIGINRHKIGHQEEYQIQGVHKPIIDNDTWNTAQKLRESNKRIRPSKQSQPNFLLSGIIRCPKCEGNMYGFTSFANSKHYRYYRCKGCGSICRADKIEEAVLLNLEKLLCDKKIINDVIAKASQYQDNNASFTDLELLKKEIARTQNLLDKYILLIENEEFKSSMLVISKIKELENKLIKLTSSKSKLEESKTNQPVLFTPEDYIKEISKVLRGQDIKLIKTIVDASIQTITLTTDNLLKEIELNFKRKDNN